MEFGTKLLHTGNENDEVTGGLSIPITQVSTFKQRHVDKFGPYDYARSGNPTRDAIENIIAELEGGTKGFAFASGMAAIASVFSIFSAGDHFIATRDVYGGTYRALTKLFTRFGIETTFVDATNLEAIKNAIQPNTKAIYIETPSNPILNITDIRGVAEIARKNNITSIIDNTFMTPYLQQPLSLGIDIVIHSATKFIGGHSDVIAGLVVTKDEVLAKEIQFVQNCFGAVLGPQDCWLLARGIKTLKVRVDQQQSNALEIAKWLQKQEIVEKVFYPGLQDHSGYEIHKKQSKGPGAVVSFLMESEELAKKVLENVKIPALAVSLGGVESIISYPPTMSHAAIPPKEREKLGVTPNIIRLSPGLEDYRDLIKDLDQAFYRK